MGEPRAKKFTGSNTRAWYTTDTWRRTCSHIRPTIRFWPKYLHSIILIQRLIWEVLPVLCLFQNSCNPHGLRTWSFPLAVCWRQNLVWAPSEREVGSLSVPLFLQSSLSQSFGPPAKKQICFTVSHKTGQIISANTTRCNINTIENLPVLQTSLWQNWQVFYVAPEEYPFPSDHLLCTSAATEMEKQQWWVAYSVFNKKRCKK